MEAARLVYFVPREYVDGEGFGSLESQSVAGLASTPLYFGTYEKTGSARRKAQGKEALLSPGGPGSQRPGPATHPLHGASAFASPGTRMVYFKRYF